MTPPAARDTFARRTFGFAPTRRLAWCVALTAPVWLVSDSRAGLVAAIGVTLALVVVAMIDMVALPARAHITVERRFLLTIGVGDPAVGEYRVRSQWRVNLVAELFDRLPAAVTPLADAMPAFALPSGGDARVERAVTGAQRGDHALGPVAVRVRAPLGLITRTFRGDPGDAIRGIPSVAAVRRFRLASVQHRMRALGVRPVRPRGEGSSFANLRDYSIGDDPRHIDWKATARRGKVIAREYSIEQGQQILIVIDAGRLMTQIAGDEDRPRFEYALSSALVLADLAVHSGDAVGVVVFDDVVRRYVAPARGPGAVRAVREALTAAEARLVEPDYATAFRTIATRQRNRALIVVFSDVLDVRASRTLIAHLSVSTTRHLPLVVALRNEDVTRAALPGGRATSGAIYHAAAAEELLTARELALTTMRAAGVSVVNVAPTAMTAAVVNRYLDIKARAAL